MLWITQENMNITEERTKTKTHNIASLIPFSARHFKKSTSETKVDLKSDRLRILPLIAFQVKIISYRKVACYINSAMCEGMYISESVFDL